jgi:hypothetical protein
MVLVHAAHVGEEAWGRFWLIDAFFGMSAFLIVNGIGVALALTLLYAVHRGSRVACAIAIGYAAVMGFQGIGHNAATVVTGRYFGGFAGGVTGVALLAISVPLVGALRRALRS